MATDIRCCACGSYLYSWMGTGEPPKDWCDDCRPRSVPDPDAPDEDEATPAKPAGVVNPHWNPELSKRIADDIARMFPEKEAGDGKQ